MNMFCVKTEYFRLNRILLLAVGLWPYQRSKLIQFHIILCFTVLISFIIFQLTTLLTAKRNSAFIFKVFSSVCIFLASIMQYNAFLDSKTVKFLLEKLQHIYNKLTDEKEIAIIKEYGNEAKLYTVVFTSFVLGCITLLSCLPFWPLILDIILPINQSRPRLPPFVIMDYFIDEEKYFYLTLLHINMSYYIGGIVILGTFTTILVCAKHTCGIFKIASYRIEQAMTMIILRLRMENDIYISEAMISNEIANAIDIHRKAMKYFEFLISSFEGTFFFLLIITVSSLSLNLFRVSEIILLGNDIVEFLIYFGSVIVILIYMFISNYIGQNIIDHNENIYLTAYNIQWYIAPLSVQKMILMLLQRGSKAFCPKIGGIFIVSLDTFAKLIKISVSYFTVMHSMQ